MSRIFARLACALLMFAGAAWADPPQFLIPHGPPAHAPAHGFRSLGHPVRVNAATLGHMRAAEEAQVRLPNATQHTYVLKLVQSHGDGIQSFVGYLKDRGNLYHAIVTTGPTGSFGVFSTPDGEFRLVPGDGHDWLIDMTAEQEYLPIMSLGNDAKVSPPTEKDFVARYAAEPIATIPGVNLAFIEKATPTPQYGADIMFVVTQGLANRLGGGLMTRLHNLVVSANTAYAASEVALTLRIVGVEVVNYTDTNDNGVALGNISPSDAGFNAAVFGNIETRRTAVGADFVAFMRDGGSFGGSGVAWIGGITGVLPNATVTNPLYMYSVTTGCVVGCESVFIHEVGHNMGNNHDRKTYAWQGGGDPDGSLVGAAYGYALCPGGYTCNANLTPAGGGCASGTQPECVGSATGSNNFSEIMAYFQASTTKNLKFSNPNVTCIGNIGPALPCGDAAGADTAASMNARRQAYSAIRGTVQTPPLSTPGSVQFTATTFFATETAGNASVTVSRVGGSSGGITVQYATANGTATAGADYTTSAGQLQWNDGDTTNRTISIPIANDGVTEGGETFTVTLSSVAGLAGAFLGKPDVATVIINEAWPPGGTPPAGFTNPSGPAWAIANDQSADGDGVSWKSGALTFSGAVPAASATQYTATFSAGTVAFAYRVNSYPGLGAFEFLIDGVVVSSNSGDSGWVSYSGPLTAGTHTLIWRYRPTLSFPCANAIPAPPQGAACADRAWIDALSLPPIATGPFALTVNQAGDGTGTVTSAPAGINCPGDCTETYAVATVVTLTATPTGGSVFSGWSGGGCSGTGTCVVTLFSATAVTATFSSAANAPRVIGISTRALVQTGDNVMIGGFIIQGGPKTVVVRARGPSTGVPGSLADPTMVIVPGAGGPNLVNDDWGTAANAAQLQASGFAPGNPKESAVLATLNPGAYTAIVSGVGNTTGVAIVEVYEIDAPQVPIVGISTRANVLTGDNVMIGGFIIQGSGPKTVVIRARGPSTGILGALADPLLTVVPAAGGPNLVNDDWQTDVNAAALLASGFAPGNTLESAILVTLNPGAYTAIVSGFGNTTGVAIVEVYQQ